MDVCTLHPSPGGTSQAATTDAATRAEAEAAAERELERVFDKSDFGRMVVLGQFNLGFILARCAVV